MSQADATPDVYSLKTPSDAAVEVAARFRRARLAKGWKQSTLAERAGVSLASLRRFETSGRIAFESLLRLAFALGRLGDFDAVLAEPRASSLAELEARRRRMGPASSATAAAK